jgi:pyruvate/2-oxoglutarate dehydrogenase complex dihydrolipoamide dehydrogenase (E3) component
MRGRPGQRPARSGYVGREFASIFRALGSTVTLVEKEPRLLPDSDETASVHLLHSLGQAGVNVLLGLEVKVEDLPRKSGTILQVKAGDHTIEPDLVLVATGRLPNVEDLGLEALEIKTKPFVEVDQNMQTSRPNIYAIGDVNGLSMLDSTALAQARTAIDAIGGKQSSFGRSWTPRCLCTNPQMALDGWKERRLMPAWILSLARRQPNCSPMKSSKCSTRIQQKSRLCWMLERRRSSDAWPSGTRLSMSSISVRCCSGQMRRPMN